MQTMVLKWGKYDNKNFGSLVLIKMLENRWDSYIRKRESYTWYHVTKFQTIRDWLCRESRTKGFTNRQKYNFFYIDKRQNLTLLCA